MNSQQQYPQSRPCRLQHAITGRIVSAPTITSFARKVHIRCSHNRAVNGFTRVLDGNLVQWRGWFNPKVTTRKRALKDRGRMAALGKNGQSLRRCHLLHLPTGREINVRSIVAFCRKARLKPPAPFHITPVLDGKRYQYKGWVLPERVNQKVSLTDVYGNQYRPVKIATLVKKHAFKARSVKHLLEGRFLPSHRLSLASQPVRGVLSPRATKVVEYVFRERDFSRRGPSRIYRGSVLKDLALRMGVDSSSLYPLMYGWRKAITKGPDSVIQAVSVQTGPRVVMADLPLA